MNQPYRVIILDDEPPARDLIEVFVNRIPDLSCVATCSNAMQGLQAIQEHSPDLLFLDIQMPEMTGLELMRLQLSNRPEIILTTAYPEYALTSYEFSVLDYLVKPIAFERFVQAVVKFRYRRTSFSTSKSEEQSIENIPSSPTLSVTPAYKAHTASIWLREEKRLLQIPYQDILYIEGLKDYIKVFLAGQTIVTHMGIGQAEKMFLPPQFVRIHRSFIVRQAAIRQIDGSVIELTSGKKLPMGPLYREELKNYISLLS